LVTPLGPGLAPGSDWTAALPRSEHWRRGGHRRRPPRRLSA